MRCRRVLQWLVLGVSGQLAVGLAAGPSDNQRLIMETRLPVVGQAQLSMMPVSSTAGDRAGTQPPSGVRVRLSLLAAEAVRSLPLIRSVAARARGDQEKAEQARAALRPNAAATLRYQKELENSGTTMPFQNYAGGVQLTIPVYRPQASANVDAARLLFESTSAAKIETERDLLAALATAYIGAAQLEQETSSLAAERDGLIAQRDLNQRRMQGGAGTLVEVLETAARAELVQALVRGAEGAEKFQLAEVARLANAPVMRVMRLGDGTPALIVPPLADAALALARQENTTLTRLRLAADSARATVTAQKAGASPTVDLVGSMDRSRIEFGAVSSQAPSAQVGVRVAVPLFTGGLIDSRVREAEAAVERVEADLQDAELTIRADVAKAYADLDRAKAQMAANNSALAISLTSLKATGKAFDAGVRGNIDVINAQQQTFSSRREAMRARAAYLLAQVRILALTGLLSLDAIKKLEAALTE